MVILHIASISTDLCNGVCVIVPQHVIAQSQFANVGFMNITNIAIDEIEQQLPYTDDFNINSLDKPFDKPDLVVFHETYRIEYIKIAKNLKKNNIPYITIPHGELGKEAQKKKHLKKTAANILIFNRFINSALAVQCLSKREYETTNFGRRKIIATNGMNLPSRTKEKFNVDKIDFLYIGRLDAYHKGLDLLIEAVSIKSDFLRKNNCKFSIYGPDILERAKTLNDLIEKYGVDDLITVNPPVSGDEKSTRLVEADIFIQTSRFEGMPLGVLEALSYGLPCLVTRGTTLGESIQENNAGWMAEVDAEDIAKKLEIAVKDVKRLDDISVNSKKFFMDNYLWETVARDTLSIYEELLRDKNG